VSQKQLDCQVLHGNLETRKIPPRNIRFHLGLVRDWPWAAPRDACKLVDLFDVLRWPEKRKLETVPIKREQPMLTPSEL